MTFALGAVSSALEALQALFSPKSSSSQTTGFSQFAAEPFALPEATSGPNVDTSNAGMTSRISSETLGALLAVQADATSGASSPPNPTTALQDLFSQIDANGDGQISKSEFENALGAGGTNLAQADDVFSKLDTNGNGSVSLDELSSALKGAGHFHQHHHAKGSAGSSGKGGSDGASLLQALDGASSTSVSNSDGSTTTEITYADGSKVTLTTPAAPSSSNPAGSNSASSTYNFVERLIQREAQTLASSASPLSVTA